MTTHRKIRRILIATIAAGAAGATAMIVGGAASADTPPPTSSVLPCTSDQFTAKLVPGDAGAGNRYGAIQLTGKKGERCYVPGKLPVTLVGAHNVLIDNQAPDDAPAVALSDGSSAYAQLHWTGVESTEDQQTPNAISVTASNVTLPWNLGPVDAGQQSHRIDVGQLTQGTAPYGLKPVDCGAVTLDTGAVHDLIATPAANGIVGCTEAFNVVDEFVQLPPEKRAEASLGNVELASGWSCTVDDGITANLSCVKDGFALHTEQR